MTRQKWIVLVALIAFGVPASAEHPRQDVGSLAGIGRFEVEICNLGPIAKRVGLTEPRLRTLIEASLRKSRLPVAAKVAGSPLPVLYISVSMMELEKTGTIVYTVRVEFKQLVVLANDREKVNFATTWSAGNFGYAGSLKTDVVKETVLEQVDDFINSFSEANP